jgi:hypothetical protein
VAPSVCSVCAPGNLFQGPGRGRPVLARTVDADLFPLPLVLATLSAGAGAFAAAGGIEPSGNGCALQVCAIAGMQVRARGAAIPFCQAGAVLLAGACEHLTELKISKPGLMTLTAWDRAGSAERTDTTESNLASAATRQSTCRETLSHSI